METNRTLQVQQLETLSRQRSRGILAILAKHWQEYLCISPFFILFLFFFAFPICWAFILSFHRWDGVNVPRWVGFDNYAFIIRDPLTLKVFANAFVFLALLLPLGLLLPLFFGVILNLSFLKLRGVFRTLIFLPVVTSGVIVGIVFKFIFGAEYGWLNSALALVGLGPYPWLRAEGWAYIPIITLTIWGGLGYATLIVLGGLQSIEQEIYEAAAIDGANQWHLFWRITLPLMRPVMTYLLITSTLGVMAMFSQPYVLTGGGPSNSTLTPMLYVYNITFGGRIGDATALSFVFSALLLIITFIQFRALRGNE